MDKRYEGYALADRHFHETPDRLSAGDRAGTAAPGYETAGRAVPEGWRAARIGDWLTLTPVDDGGRPRPGPTRGWKVHASATRANADRIAAIVWDYCVPRRIPFKFVPGLHLLHLSKPSRRPATPMTSSSRSTRPTRTRSTSSCASWAHGAADGGSR